MADVFDNVQVIYFAELPLDVPTQMICDSQGHPDGVGIAVGDLNIATPPLEEVSYLAKFASKR